MKEQLIYTATPFLQEMLMNIKTCDFHSPVNHQEHLFHRTLITSYFHPVNIAKFRTPSETVVYRCSSK